MPDPSFQVSSFTGLSLSLSLFVFCRTIVFVSSLIHSSCPHSFSFHRLSRVKLSLSKCILNISGERENVERERGKDNGNNKDFVAQFLQVFNDSPSCVGENISYKRMTIKN